MNPKLMIFSSLVYNPTNDLRFFAVHQNQIKLLASAIKHNLII